MKAKSTLLSGKAGLCLLCATTILTLTGCDPYMGAGVGTGGGYGGGYRGNSYAPAYGRSNYTYYPQHQTYYHPQTNMYHYRQGNSWTSSTRPYGVSHTALRSSPSVPLNLNGHPQNHHSGVGQSYPRNWSGNSNGNRGGNGNWNSSNHGNGNGHDHDHRH